MFHVMEQRKSEDNKSWKSKMKEMNEELEEKDEQMDDLEQLNRILLVKERQSNYEGVTISWYNIFFYFTVISNALVYEYCLLTFNNTMNIFVVNDACLELK